MSNGQEFLNELELEKLIKRQGDRELLEFVARQSYETKKETNKLCGRLSSTEKRSTQNRLILIGLILILITLGILDSTILHIFGV